MKQFFNLIGSIVTLLVIGYLIIGAFSIGKPLIGISIIAICIVIYFFSVREDNLTEQRNRKAIQSAEAFNEERKRIEKIESMSDDEFIRYIKANHNRLHETIKNGAVIKLGHGISTTRYSTKKYFIDLEIEDNDFNKFITIIRKNDNIEIFSGSWGYR